MTRYSQAVVDEAIEALLCTADDARTGHGGGVSGAAPQAVELEDASLIAVWDATSHRLHIGDDLLGLLLDGWRPGDDVHAIGGDS